MSNKYHRLTLVNFGNNKNYENLINNVDIDDYKDAYVCVEKINAYLPLTAPFNVNIHMDSLSHNFDNLGGKISNSSFLDTFIGTSYTNAGVQSAIFNTVNNIESWAKIPVQSLNYFKIWFDTLTYDNTKVLTPCPDFAYILVLKVKFD
jgi:hypothetical protein